MRIEYKYKHDRLKEDVMDANYGQESHDPRRASLRDECMQTWSNGNNEEDADGGIIELSCIVRFRLLS